MRSARLDLALESGVFVPPSSGVIAVFRPRAGDDLSALPTDRVEVITGFRPDHDHFLARGYRVQAAAEGPYVAALVCLPRARAGARALIADAARRVAPGGPVAVDGQKHDGIDAALKDLRGRVEVSDPLSKAHGKLFVFAGGADLWDWQAQPIDLPGGFRTLPGVFSADGPDRGSELLAAALPDDLGGHIADLGAGWGFLSRAILAHPRVKRLDLVEAEADALECARANVTDERARFHWADATGFRPDRLLDHVVMNPPFHTGREADPNLGLAFIRAAAQMLAPSGHLWMVANRHLPYDRALPGLFREVQEIGGDAAFRLTRASFPIRSR
ncbi:MAG: class I SAM-dependent methyltransferase [Paracoccaceae bacterium]